LVAKVDTKVECVEVEVSQRMKRGRRRYIEHSRLRPAIERSTTVSCHDARRGNTFVRRAAKRFLLRGTVSQQFRATEWSVGDTSMQVDRSFSAPATRVPAVVEPRTSDRDFLRFEKGLKNCPNTGHQVFFQARCRPAWRMRLALFFVDLRRCRGSVNIA
jgi:hypothetical protein